PIRQPTAPASFSTPSALGPAPRLFSRRRQTPGRLPRLCRGSGLVGNQRRLPADLVPDPDAMRRLAQETETDDDADRGDCQRVEQPGQRDAGGPGEQRPDEWDAPAEPTIPDVVG